MLGNCPHDWLFQHVSCVVHHGGAGTTAAGIALGRPTVIVPFFGDQPFWGSMIARAGAGPPPVPFKELTARKLADGILLALKPETLDRARELGERIRGEKGAEVGAEGFHRQMDVDGLRCRLDPGRVAVWHVKAKTRKGKGKDKENEQDRSARGIRLSAFAAAVLADKGILDMNELALYRPCEYAVEEHPILSNLKGTNPVLGTLGSVATEVIRWPVQAGKALGGVAIEPYKGAKADGWRGFGRGLGRGIGHFLFPRRGIFVTYGILAIYRKIKKSMGAGTLSYILAVRFAQGFEEFNGSSEEEREEIVKRWNELDLEVEVKKSGTNTLSLQSSSGSESRGLTSDATK